MSYPQLLTADEESATPPAATAVRWRVEMLFNGRWVPRSSARDTEPEAIEVRDRLQSHQPGEEFRVQPVDGAS